MKTRFSVEMLKEKKVDFILKKTSVKCYYSSYYDPVPFLLWLVGIMLLLCCCLVMQSDSYCTRPHHRLAHFYFGYLELWHSWTDGHSLEGSAPTPASLPHYLQCSGGTLLIASYLVINIHTRTHTRTSRHCQRFRHSGLCLHVYMGIPKCLS